MREPPRPRPRRYHDAIQRGGRQRRLVDGRHRSPHHSIRPAAPGPARTGRPARGPLADQDQRP